MSSLLARRCFLHCLAFLFALLSALLSALLLGGCGSGEDPPAVEQPAPPLASSALIGAAGGSLTGPDDVRLEVPAGALAGDTVITITRDGSGAPARAATNTANSTAPIYAITPHGLAFAVPATLTLPAALLPASTDEDVDLLRAQPGGAWEALPAQRAADGSVSVALSGLSYYTASGRGYTSRLSWATPLPGSTFNGNPDDRALTQSTRVKLSFYVRAFAWCNDSFVGGVQLWRGEPGQPANTLVEEQTFAFGSTARTGIAREFEFDVAVSGAPQAYHFLPTGRCTTASPPTGNPGASPPGMLSAPSVHTRPIAAPTIVRQPADVQAVAGDSVRFSVDATAPDALEIAWQRSDDGGLNWTDLGSTAADIGVSLSASWTSSQWRARVCNRNALGANCISSSAARVTAPVVLPLAVPWQADSLLAASGTHSMAISNSQTLWTWGSNNGGALGRSSPANTPQPVTTLTSVRSVAAGAWYSVALLGNGSVWAWGWGANVGAAIGGRSTDNPLPRQVTGLPPIRAIATRYLQTIALAEDGTVWGFGPEGSGLLGPALGHERARQIPGLSRIRQIATGDNFTLALDADGTVWSWGTNSSNQLGLPSAQTPGGFRATPQAISGPNRVVTVAAASFTSFALADDGRVWSWGLPNAIGRSGDNTLPGLVTVAVAGSARVTALAAGSGNAWAILADGSVAGWGDNGLGALGSGQAGRMPAPGLLSGFGQVVQIVGGEFHSLALRADGTVLSWGGNGNLSLSGVAGPDLGVPTASGFDRAR